MFNRIRIDYIDSDNDFTVEIFEIPAERLVSIAANIDGDVMTIVKQTDDNDPEIVGEISGAKNLLALSAYYKE